MNYYRSAPGSGPEHSLRFDYNGHPVHFHPFGYIDLKSVTAALGIPKEKLVEALLAFNRMALGDTTWRDRIAKGLTAPLPSESFAWIPLMKFDHIGSYLLPSEGADRQSFANWYANAVSKLAMPAGVSQ
ncbi:hypothetical protein [Pseudomonas sp. Marseille-Q7302]